MYSGFELLQIYTLSGLLQSGYCEKFFPNGKGSYSGRQEQNLIRRKSFFDI